MNPTIDKNSASRLYNVGTGRLVSHSAAAQASQPDSIVAKFDFRWNFTPEKPLSKETAGKLTNLALDPNAALLRRVAALQFLCSRGNVHFFDTAKQAAQTLPAQPALKALAGQLEFRSRYSGDSPTVATQPEGYDESSVQRANYPGGPKRSQPVRTPYGKTYNISATAQGAIRGSGFDTMALNAAPEAALAALRTIASDLKTAMERTRISGYSGSNAQRDMGSALVSEAIRLAKAGQNPELKARIEAAVKAGGLA